MDAFWIWTFGAIVGCTAGFILAGIMHSAGSDADDAETFEHWRGER